MRTNPLIKELTKAYIRASAIKELTWRGYDVWIQNNIAVKGRKFIGRKGVPDIIGLTKDARWVVAEVKTLNDTLLPDQITFLNDIKKAGGEAYIACQEGNQVVLKEWIIQTK
jgi:hypothetical protein